MDELTRWVEENEAQIVEDAICAAFAEGVKLRISEWIYRLRDHGTHVVDGTYMGMPIPPGAEFRPWVFVLAIHGFEVDVTPNPILGLVIRSKLGPHEASVVVAREELEWNTEDPRHYELFCEVQALRIITVWASLAQEEVIGDIANTRRGERNGQLAIMNGERVREAREQMRILTGGRDTWMP